MEKERKLDNPIKNLTLTNFRIRSEFRKWGKGEIKSIMLEELSSILLLYKSKPKLILYGFILLVIFGFAGIYVGYQMREEEGGVAIVIIGLILFILFMAGTEQGLGL